MGNSSTVCTADGRCTVPSREQNIAKYVNSQIESSTFLMVSKSTCSACKKAKQLFERTRNELGDSPHIVEIDSYGPDVMRSIQDLLARKTGCRTVPQIFFHGRFVGGNSDCQDLWRRGMLGATYRDLAKRRRRPRRTQSMQIPRTENVLQISPMFAFSPAPKAPLSPLSPHHQHQQIRQPLSPIQTEPVKLRPQNIQRVFQSSDWTVDSLSGSSSSSEMAFSSSSDARVSRRNRDFEEEKRNYPVSRGPHHRAKSHFSEPIHEYITEVKTPRFTQRTAYNTDASHKHYRSEVHFHDGLRARVKPRGHSFDDVEEVVETYEEVIPAERINYTGAIIL